jgi:hypothetical protein
LQSLIARRRDRKIALLDQAGRAAHCEGEQKVWFLLGNALPDVFDSLFVGDEAVERQ